MTIKMNTTEALTPSARNRYGWRPRNSRHKHRDLYFKRNRIKLRHGNPCQGCLYALYGSRSCQLGHPTIRVPGLANYINPYLDAMVRSDLPTCPDRKTEVIKNPDDSFMILVLDQKDNTGIFTVSDILTPGTEEFDDYCDKLYYRQDDVWVSLFGGKVPPKESLAEIRGNTAKIKWMGESHKFGGGKSNKTVRIWAKRLEDNYVFTNSTERQKLKSSLMKLRNHRDWK